MRKLSTVVLTIRGVNDESLYTYILLKKRIEKK